MILDAEHRFWKTSKSVQLKPESVFTINQNGCSRCSRIGVQLRPEYATACVEAYAEDAALYVSGHEPLKGRDAIRPVLEEWVRLGAKLAQVEVLEVRASGAIGYCAGKYEFSMASVEGVLVPTRGKFVTIFMQHTDGSWKAVMDCLIDD